MISWPFSLSSDDEVRVGIDPGRQGDWRAFRVGNKEISIVRRMYYASTTHRR